MSADERDDLWLRDTLSDAVSDVEPRRGVEEIGAAVRARRRRRGAWVAGGTGLLVAATVTGIALAAGLPGSDPEAGPAAPGPSQTASATEPDTEPSPGSDAAPAEGPLPVYYIGDTPTGPRLFREFRAADAGGDALDVAVGTALSTAPLDPDYRTPWPEGVEGSTSYDRDLITIDLSSNGTDLRGRPGGLSAAEAQLALEQLIHTAQGTVQSRSPVRFLLDGSVTDQLLGQPASEPLVQGDPMAVQAPVWVITPQDGDEVPGSLTVEGRGAFFEANVSWQVLQDGEVVREGFTTAQECCTLAPYSFTVPELPDGDYVLRVYDADVSGGEGPGEHEDTKSFSVGSAG